MGVLKKYQYTCSFKRDFLEKKKRGALFISVDEY